MTKTLVLDHHDCIKAINRHRLFPQYREIHRKAKAGITLTIEEEARQWDGNFLNRVAKLDLEAKLSMEVRERTGTGEACREWGAAFPEVDRVNSTCTFQLPLKHPTETLVQFVALHVRTYKFLPPGPRKRRRNRQDLPPLPVEDCNPTLKNQLVVLRTPFPFDHPIDEYKAVVQGIVYAAKQRLGLRAPQRIAQPGQRLELAFAVYDLFHNHNRTFENIAHQIFDIPADSHTENSTVRRSYDRVRRAYRFAKKAIDCVGRGEMVPPSFLSSFGTF